MHLGIDGRVALVHGAGGGLGSAIALALAQEGVKVAICDISADALSHTAHTLENAGAQFLAVQWDLADRAGFAAKLAHVEQQLGSVDILVNNTGGPPPSAVQAIDQQVWTDQFNAMVLSVIAMTDLVVPGMKHRRWGRIITSASSGVIAPIANLGLSNTLRSALVGWSKTLSNELGSFGVTTNVVVPGRIATQRIRRLDEARAQREGRAVEEVIRASVGDIPLQRYGEPHEYAAMVTFLASEKASYVTGSVVRIDGGYISNV